MEARRLRVGRPISPEEFDDLSDEQLLRLPLMWVLLGLGGLACALTWRKLTP